MWLVAPILDNIVPDSTSKYFFEHSVVICLALYYVVEILGSSSMVRETKIDIVQCDNCCIK